MKKNIVAGLVFGIFLCVCIFGLAACKTDEADGKPSVVVTVFPEYDWVENVLGEKKDDFSLTLLQDNGVDLHSYRPTAKDVVAISACDLFIYVGGESDEWAEDALRSPVNRNRRTISLLDVLGDRARPEETAEGMQSEDEEEEEEEYDEHVWLSLRNARLFVTEIADALSALDEANADTYRANANAYCAQLSDLDREYRDAVATATTKTFVFGDRFPFLYLFKDYGLTYYAAFKGCSAESEASFQTVAFLAGKVDELGLTTIWKLESSDGAIARTVKENTTSKDQTILTLDSLQSGANGRTYLSAMQYNLDTLKRGF